MGSRIFTQDEVSVRMAPAAGMRFGKLRNVKSSVEIGVKLGEVKVR